MRHGKGDKQGAVQTSLQSHLIKGSCRLTGLGGPRGGWYSTAELARLAISAGLDAAPPICKHAQPSLHLMGSTCEVYR